MDSSDAHDDMDSTPQTTPKAEQDVAAALLQNLNPLMEKLIPAIKTIIVDYIIAMRKHILTGDEFVTIRQAARRLDISVPTLYMWKDKGILNPLHIEGKIYVSISEVRFAKQTIYQPAKATKQSGRKIKTVIESRSQHKIEVRNGLPYMPHLQGDSKEDSREI
jgi:hypothetical protein